MAKKKYRPASPGASVKTANRQRSAAEQEGTSPSSVAGGQKEPLSAQNTGDSLDTTQFATEERQKENVTTRQAKSQPATAGGTSASERRRKRVESRRTSSTARSAPSANEKRRRAVRKSWWETNSVLLIGGILVVVVIVIGVFIIIGNSPSNGTTGPTDPGILKKVTNVKPSVLANVKDGGMPDVLQVPPGNASPLTGPNGKPEVFFYGAEFCPFCGAERWSVTIALSRFGTFKELPLIVSSENSIPTFTYHGSQYSSNYIDFVPLEAEGQTGQSLETASDAQQQLLKQYNITGFPFIDIANKYIAKDAAIADPTILKGLSQQQIADMLSDPTQGVTQKIVGAANYFTAAICMATNNQPANVCNSDPIPAISKALPTTAVASLPATPLSVATENCSAGPATCRRRGDALL